MWAAYFPDAGAAALATFVCWWLSALLAGLLGLVVMMSADAVGWPSTWRHLPRIIGWALITIAPALLLVAAIILYLIAFKGL